MKAILMAAGRGTRISRDIAGIPKSTLRVGGQPLIRRTISQLLSRGIDVCAVVGYRQKEVRQSLSGLPVEIVENPFYAVTNSMASLWFAKNFWTNDDILLINADLLIDEAILDAIIKEPRSPVMAADPRRICEGDFFFAYTPKQQLVAFGKELPVAERSGEYLGIAKIKREDRNACLTMLQELIGQERYADWWERVLYHRVEEGLGPVHVMEVRHSFWSEIDSYDDYLGIQAEFENVRLKQYG